MTEQRLPVTIKGYTPGQLEQRWCENCGTTDGFRLPFFKKLANTDPESPDALAVLGCFACKDDDEDETDAAPGGVG